jgi:hypothetical protein
MKEELEKMRKICSYLPIWKWLEIWCVHTIKINPSTLGMWAFVNANASKLVCKLHLEFEWDET